MNNSKIPSQVNSKKLVELSIQKLDHLSVAKDSKWFWQYAMNRKKNFEIQINKCIKLKNSYFSKKPSFIDIGSAPFVLPLGLKLSNEFSQITSIDIDPFRYKNIEKTEIDILKLDVDNPEKGVVIENFDIIYFSHIFEHLRINLIETMSFLRSILNKGGIIYIETPNAYSLKGCYNKLFRGISTGCASDLYEEWEKIERFGHMGHIREYSLQELSTFFQKMNFEIIQKGYCGKYQGSSIKKKSIIFFQTLFPKFKNDIFFVLKAN